ncbi:MAG TPA: YncE family protein [Solirubrobacterales bacterium]|nr:YncE family protein [Solirubrobacterales bacterium]
MTRRLPLAVVSALAAFAALAPLAAAAKPAPGTLTQLRGKAGCLVDRSAKPGTCARARALKGPGPFMGSRAIAVSPDGRNVYVASAGSDAVAIFTRNRKSGALTQSQGKAGCVSARGASGCAKVVGIDGPNSVAVSPDGRNVYVTSRDSSTLLSFRRNPKTGALHPIPGATCITGIPTPLFCAVANGMITPDVVVVSPDGANVYVGAFFGNSVASFARDPGSGALTQLSGTAGCIAEATAHCATGNALQAIEGLAISGDGATVYAAAAVSNGVAVLTRDPATGALSQATGGSGCIIETALLGGCTHGRELAGANAAVVSPDDGNLYVTSLLSNSVTAFDRNAGSGALVQKEATNACLVFLRSAGCSFGRALEGPEGIDVSPDGRNVYVASFRTGAIDVLARNAKGAVRQLPGKAGCVGRGQVQGCTPGRVLAGVSSVAVSPDGRNVYATAFESNAVDVFRRNR